jgi:hypothetical protein
MTETTYRNAIIFVGAVLILSTIGIIVLATGVGGGRPIPDILQLIASSSLTGLIGLLVQPTKGTGLRRRNDVGHVDLATVVAVIAMILGVACLALLIDILFKVI